jgi:hypothetical protein
MAQMVIIMTTTTTMITARAAVALAVAVAATKQCYVGEATFGWPFLYGFLTIREQITKQGARNREIAAYWIM